MFDEEIRQRLVGMRLPWIPVSTGARRGDRQTSRPGGEGVPPGHRLYVPGDDIRQIDWPAYARLDQLHVRPLAEPGTQSCTLLLDTSRSMGFGYPPKLDMAKAIAACIAFVLSVGKIRAQWVHATGVARFSDPSLFYRQLSEVEPARTPALAPVLMKLRQSEVPQGLVILSDFLWNREKDSSSFYEELKLMTARGWQTVCIQVWSDDEMAPTLSGAVRAIDCETGDTHNLHVTDETLRIYANRRDAVLEEMRQACATMGVRHARVTSSEPLARVLFETLRKAAILE